MTSALTYMIAGVKTSIRPHDKDKGKSTYRFITGAWIIQVKAR